MRWAFGSRKQIAWAFTMIVLRIAIFGVVYLVILPALALGSHAKVIEALIFALLAIGFVAIFLLVVARAFWRELGFSGDDLSNKLLLGLATFGVGLVFIASHGAHRPSSPKPFQRSFVVALRDHEAHD